MFPPGEAAADRATAGRLTACGEGVKRASHRQTGVHGAAARSRVGTAGDAVRWIEERPAVLVVGLGPAGARAAAVAACAGCSVLAVERRRSVGDPLQCAEFVSGALGLQGLCWEQVTSQRIARMVTVVESLEPRVSEDFRGRMICRGAFDRALARQAVASGARILLGAAVAQVLADGAVRLSNGRLLRPRALIGADGPRSLVGAAIGHCNRQLVAARQARVPLTRPYEATDIFLRAEYPGGYGWLFPKAGVANLGVGVDFQDRHRLKSLLRGLHEDLAAAGRVSAGAPLTLTGGLIPVGGRLRAIGHLGAVPVILAGDAAGLTNPVTGAGIEAAVHSGALAGAAAASWLGGCSTAPEEYESELSELYDGAHARALRRRRELLEALGRGRVTAEALWDGWIASANYWLDTPAAGVARTDGPGAAA